MTFGGSCRFGEVLLDVGRIEGWPRCEVVLLNGINPGGVYRAVTGSMEESYMVFDAMSDTCYVIGLGDLVKRGGDRPQTVWGSSTLKEELAMVMDLGMMLCEGCGATCIAKFSD